MDVFEKLSLLAAAARYDVSCASSGSARSIHDGRGYAAGRRSLGSSVPTGVCHSWSEDGRCISLLKVLFSNACVYDCAYCLNRRSNPGPRTSFTEEELVGLTIGFYRRNYIEGLFLSSGVVRDPDYTMARLLRVAQILRVREQFHGYIHIKVIPGASESLIKQAGYYADRLSANIELPTSESLSLLAPDKKGGDIFSAMKSLRNGILEETDYRPRLDRGSKTAVPGPTPFGNGLSLSSGTPAGNAYPLRATGGPLRHYPAKAGLPLGDPNARFVPAGQSTQIIIGASPEQDRRILELTSDLYRAYGLKRVYYSAFVALNPDPRPPACTAPPLRREHRLYQADWLLRFYGFGASELVDELHPDLDLQLDPKASWALRHQEEFPVEVTKAGYRELLRVPGIGRTAAVRLLRARKEGPLSLEQLRGFGVVMKRAVHFITCRGRHLVDLEIEPERLRTRLLQAEDPHQRDSRWGQLYLFGNGLGGMG